MSAIAGIYSPRQPELADAARLQRMLDALRRRGGPEEHRWFDPAAGCALGHLHRKPAPGADPGGSDPPGWHAVDDGVATLDGSLTNASELLGANEAPASSARAVTASRRRHRGDFARHLEGNFGLASWDAASRVLCLARDALGTKPLYYHHEPASGLLLFASEPTGVLAHGVVRRRVDASALALFLTFGYVPAPFSLFAGIRKVFPGTALGFDSDGRMAERSFWKMPKYEPAELGFEALARATRERVIERFERQLRDVDSPGVLLSGGVDSTLLLGILRILGRREVDTFTLGFDLEGVGPRLSADLEWGAHVARRFSTRHHSVIFRSDHRLGLQRVWQQLDEPMSSPNTYSKSFLFEAAKRAGSSHCLSGLGAEDLFDQVSEKKLRKLRARVGGDADPIEIMLARYGRFLSFDEQRELLVEPCESARDHALEMLRRYSADVEASDLGQRMLLTSMRMLGAEKSIAIQDRTSVSSGIEARHPFQDAPLLAFSRTIPVAEKRAGGVQKALLKAAFADVLPREVAEREKLGYPSYHWNRGELASLEERLLSREALARTGLFREEAVRRLLAEDAVSQHKSAGKKTWGLLAIQAWYELHVREDESLLELP